MRYARSLSGLSALAGLLIGSLTVLAAAGASAADGSIGADELARRMDAGNAPLVLDVRTPKEFAEGHIPGAVNIPHNELSSRLDEIADHRDDEIVVHCRTGRRAKIAEGVLHEAGFTKVIDLDGHWMGWRAAGHPMETGSGAVKGGEAKP